MFLTYLMLAVALCLSAVAAFYSIVGLAAIFAAAVMPIVLMGSILEVAKLVVTVWLHEYWNQVKRSMKIYLVPAVGVLMLITSMGIFGFLSKAHLDQAVPTGEVAAKVAVIDEKIKTQRDNIDTARRALAQMDAQVDQVLGRTTDDKGAERAVQIRRQQAAERTRLQRDIATAQTAIAKLNEERAPIASELRKVEAEVGPIKYIAALIYGDNPEVNTLEKAVRWVIIILVLVFDPLAVMMLLAATESMRWERERRANGFVSPPEDGLDNRARLQAWRDRWNRWRNRNAVVNDDTTVTPDVDERSTGDNLDLEPVAEVVGQPIPAEQWGGQDLTERFVAQIEHTPIEVSIEDIKPATEALDEWQDRHDEEGNLYFGRVWPRHANRGDLFIKINTLPTTLYKFNGEKWIETSKSLSDRYAQNDAYIDFLIRKISNGEYDPELLNDVERAQIESRLKKDL